MSSVYMHLAVYMQTEMYMLVPAENVSKQRVMSDVLAHIVTSPKPNRNERYINDSLLLTRFDLEA